MRPIVQNVLIVAKSGDERAVTAAQEIASWLGPLGVDCLVTQNKTSIDGCLGPKALLGDCAAPDLAVVLGGDGTMISVARKLMNERVPIIGINMGRLGFLTQLAWEDCRPELTNAVLKGFGVSSVSMFQCEVAREGRQVFSCGAVNDVVVSRGAIARLVRLGVYFGGERLGGFRADGMVVSTPTGATAYSMSAGGPLVHPDLETFTLTPICPFLDNFKPMVLPTDRHIDLKVEEAAAEVMLTCDGQTLFRLGVGDWVRVRRAAHPLKLASVGNYTYFGKLLDKGFIKER